MSSIIISQILTFVIYISLGILAIFIYGSEIEKSVLTNVNLEEDIFSYIIRVAFMIVLACHIPYIFFVLKESLLIVVDEARNKSMSKDLYQRISEQQKDEEQTEGRLSISEGEGLIIQT